MKKIGLVGGLTWVSTVEYYRLLNQKVNERKGGSEAAEIILYSVNFGTIRRLTEAGEWDQIAQIISEAALRIQEAGADCVLLTLCCQNGICEFTEGSPPARGL